MASTKKAKKKKTPEQIARAKRRASIAKHESGTRRMQPVRWLKRVREKLDDGTGKLAFKKSSMVSVVEALRKFAVLVSSGRIAAVQDRLSSTDTESVMFAGLAVRSEVGDVQSIIEDGLEVYGLARVFDYDVVRVSRYGSFASGTESRKHRRSLVELPASRGFRLRLTIPEIEDELLDMSAVEIHIEMARTLEAGNDKTVRVGYLAPFAEARIQGIEWTGYEEYSLCSDMSELLHSIATIAIGRILPLVEARRRRTKDIQRASVAVHKTTTKLTQVMTDASDKSIKFPKTKTTNTEDK